MGVRSEVVRLSLEDAGFSTKMASDAAAAIALAQALDYLDGRGVNVSRSMPRAASSIDDVGRAAKSNDGSINQLTGRLRLMADAAAVLGPSLIPIGAVAIPAVAGLANQFGFAAVAAGTAVLAFQGVGGALEALSKASLEPTVENLSKAREALNQLSPAGRELVSQLHEMRPLFTSLRDTAQAGLFPGLIEGFEELERLAPRIEGIVDVVSTTLGDLFAQGAESLAGPRWADFFDMLEAEAKPTLTSMSSALGDFIHGMSELWQVFMPLNRDFGSWLERSAASFDRWAQGLDQTDGFQEFVEYIRTNGPRVAEALSALGDALVQIVEAVAPLGGPSLQIIESFSKAIATIADSDFGTPIFAGIAALAALNRTLKVTAALSAAPIFAGGLFGGSAGSSRATSGIRNFTNALLYVPTAAERATRGTERWTKAEEKRQATLRQGIRASSAAAGAIGLFAAASTDAEDSLVGLNTETGALIGLMAGGPLGAGIGAVVGNILDMKAAYEQTAAAIDGDMTTALDSYKQRMDDLSFSDPWNWLTGAGVRAGIQDTISLLKDGETQTSQLAKAAASWQSAGSFGDFQQRLEDVGLTMEDVKGNANGLAGALRKQERQTARSEARAKALADALDKQRDAALQAGASMSDYSQKVELGTISIDRLMKRWDKLAEASRNMSQNIRDAIEGGLDPAVIKDVIDQLGPQGAAGALQDLADASPREAAKIVRSFNRMSSAGGEVASVYDWLEAQINGNGLSLNPQGVVKGAKGAKQGLLELSSGVSGAIFGLETLGRQHPKPKADLDTAPLMNQANRANNTLNVLNKNDAKPKVDLDGAPAAVQAANGVRNAILGIKDRTVTVKVNTINVPQLFDSGGFTGRGSKHEIAGVVHRGEVVIPQDLVRRDWSLLKGRYGHLPGFADGGVVGDGPHTRSLDNDVERWSRQTALALKQLANSAAAGGSTFAGVFTQASRTGKGFDSALDRSVKSLERELRIRERMLTKEQEAVQEKIAALREEREAIIASVEARLADPFDTSGNRTAEDFLGDTTGMTSQEIYEQQQIAQELADSLQQSPNDILQGNIDELNQLSQLIEQLKNLGLRGDALAALIAGGDISQIQALIAGGRDEVRDYQQLYNQQQDLAQQVGQQAFGATGGAAQLRHLVAQNRELSQELKALNRKQEHAAKQRDRQHNEQKRTTKATEGVGEDTARALDRSANRAMTGARRRGR